jgi:hypothetical protein
VEMRKGVKPLNYLLISFSSNEATSDPVLQDKLPSVSFLKKLKNGCRMYPAKVDTVQGLRQGRGLHEVADL